MASLPLVQEAAELIEFGGACVITFGVVRAVAALIGGHGILEARLLAIGGVLGGLGFKTAATLLKAIELGTWHGIAVFASILLLRTAIKQVFLWERGRLVPPAQAHVDEGLSSVPRVVSGS